MLPIQLVDSRTTISDK